MDYLEFEMPIKELMEQYDKCVLIGEESEIEGIKTGADAYVTKPFNSEKLKVWVEKLIENRRQLQRYFSKTLSINPELAITSTESDFLKRLQTVLDKHITDSEFTSDGFGKLMLMSRTQLYRKIKALTGKSATAYIRSFRLNKAKELIINSDKTIREIAYETGFSDPSYFHRSFVKEFSKKPTDFRK